MSVYKTYKGSRLDLQHYKGKSIIDYEFEILNDDGTEFDLSVYDDIVIKIFEKRHGTEVESFSMSDGDIELNSPEDNYMMWSAGKELMDLFPKLYYHECYGLIDDQEELIFHGVSEVI